MQTPLALLLPAAVVAATLAFNTPPAPSAKLDPAVQAAVDSGQTVPVAILGHTQLFARLGGLSAFEREHSSADRLALRRDVVTRLKSIARREQATILRSLGKSRAEQSLWIANVMVLTLTPAEIRRAAELPEVEFVYPSVERFASPEPTGTLQVVVPRAKPAPFSPEGKRVPWNLERLNVPRVWSELDDRGEGVTVAILDGGADYAHADLRGNIWKNPSEVPANGVDDDHNGYVDDYYGYDFANMRAEVRDTASRVQHGTWTSGIVAGDGTGGTITGVAPRASLMLLIARGPITNGMAFQYALENGADVISMSFSIPNLGNVRGLWRMMSEHAIAAGLVLVGGAGNFQTSSPIPVQVQTPKDIPGVIAVGGVDSTMQLVPFSSMGPVEWKSVALYGDYPMPNGLVKPDVVAFPGADYPVLATTGSGYIDPNTRIRGNSFSGPHGAGVAALMFAADRSLPAWKVKEILERTAHDLDAPGKDMRSGAGLIDAFAAVTEVRRAKHTQSTQGTNGWPVATPEAESLDPAPLRSLVDRARGGTFGNTDRLVVIRNGRLVVDERFPRDYREISRGKRSPIGCGVDACTDSAQLTPYNYLHPSWHPWWPNTELHTLQSVTKSVTATLIGIAIKRGEIKTVQTPLLSFFSAYKLPNVDPRLREATLADLLTMRSGIEWHENDRPLDETNTTLQLERSPDWIRFTLSQPMDADPGTKWAYNSGGSALMAEVIRSATGSHVDDYAVRHLFTPLDIKAFHWKRTPTRHPDTEGGLYLDALDLAKIGQLYMDDGVWRGARVLPAGWAREATSRTVDHVNANANAPGYGYQWWRYDRRNTDVWAGNGFGGQFLIVLPQHHIVAVANSWNVYGTPAAGILGPLIDAVLDAARVPR